MIGAIVMLAMQFEVGVQTKHGTYYVPAQGKRLNVDPWVCEKFLTSLERRFEVNVPRYSYYRVPDTRTLFQEKDLDATGVAFRDTNEIWSIYPCHRHEMVHLVSFQMGDPGAFWSEGLAVALTEGYQGHNSKRFFRKLAASDDLAELIRDFAGLTELMDRQGREDHYAATGSFMRHLLKAYGDRAIAKYFRQCSARGDSDGKIFVRTFGQPPVEMIRQWSGYQPRH